MADNLRGRMTTHGATATLGGNEIIWGSKRVNRRYQLCLQAAYALQSPSSTLLTNDVNPHDRFLGGVGMSSGQVPMAMPQRARDDLKN